jgi:hypothetical protein
MQSVENSGFDSSGSQILHPGSRLLFCQWEAMRAARPCPNREDFSLTAVRDIVPDLAILERDHIRKTFRFRLAGTRVCDLYKTNLTGTDALSGWDSFEQDVVSKHLLQTMINMQPTLLRARLTTDTKQQVAVEAILLPIRKRASEGIEILSGYFPFRQALSLGHNAIVGRELLAIRSIWTEYQDAITPRPAAKNHRFAVIEGGLT